MSVSARFYVRAVEKYAAARQTGYAAPAPMVKVSLSPVNGNRAPENEQWASATPSGEITMTIGNPKAAAWFESMLGKDVAISFEERPDDELN